MTTPTAPRDRARDEQRRELTPEEQKHLLDCQLAEQRHQFLDLDADSKFPVPDMTTHPEVAL